MHSVHWALGTSAISLSFSWCSTVSGCYGNAFAIRYGVWFGSKATAIAERARCGTTAAITNSAIFFFCSVPLSNAAHAEYRLGSVGNCSRQTTPQQEICMQRCYIFGGHESHDAKGAILLYRLSRRIVIIGMDIMGFLRSFAVFARVWNTTTKRHTAKLRYFIYYKTNETKSIFVVVVFCHRWCPVWRCRFNGKGIRNCTTTSIDTRMLRA